MGRLLGLCVPCLTLGLLCVAPRVNVALLLDEIVHEEQREEEPRDELARPDWHKSRLGSGVVGRRAWREPRHNMLLLRMELLGYE